MLLEGAFERAGPYRLHLLIGAVSMSVGVTLFAFSSYGPKVEVIDGVLAPDFIMPPARYTAEQLLPWYDAIGDGARKAYIICYLIDLPMMWMYAFLFGSQIYLSRRLPVILSYMPILYAILDFVETTTHAVACFDYPNHIPAAYIIDMAGWATYVKHFCFNGSMLLSLFTLCLGKGKVDVKSKTG